MIGKTIFFLNMKALTQKIQLYPEKEKARETVKQ